MEDILFEGGMIYEVESFLEERYQFRRNVMSGKCEMRVIGTESGDWMDVTEIVVNTIVREAKKEGIGDNKSPRQDIVEYINSMAVETYDPVKSYLDSLPEWDGNDHVGALFRRLPGVTDEMVGFLSIWFRSSVAHWLHLDMLHGNECVPVLIGGQGVGKSTFAARLLPQHLRSYYLDHINFSNKFDMEIALTSNLFVNIDEFNVMTSRQQTKLKQVLSKVKVNGRPIFGRVQADRPRYASFIATTNDATPLCDPTGSRRYICILIPDEAYIDNATPIDYGQLYAQVIHQLKAEELPYWFDNIQVERIQELNMPFYKSEDMSEMIESCFRKPKEDEQAVWMSTTELCNCLHKHYPAVMKSHSMKIHIGAALKLLGFTSRRTSNGNVYALIPRQAV